MRTFYYQVIPDCLDVLLPSQINSNNPANLLLSLPESAHRCTQVRLALLS